MTGMKYKALMIDVDGTLIENGNTNVLPSKKVHDAIEKAQKIVHVGLATSRPYPLLSHIIKTLNLSSPCIISSGAEIYDPIKNKISFEKLINKNSIRKVYKIVNNHNLIVLDDGRGSKGNLRENEIKVPTQLWIEIPNQALVENVLSELSEIPSISVHKVISRFNEKLEILVGHTEATKQHGILKVAEILGIKTSEIIGIGDGYNDFPLLMACGLKIAMGNGVKEIKAIADYIAPSVEEDGVADAIEKFILNPQ
jgi:HAD superfamily hydrolase (TIGR01484 family)